MLSSNSAETETAVKAASQSTVLHRSEPNSQSDQQLIRAFSFSSPWNSFPEMGFILFLGDSWLPAPCCWQEVWQIGNWTTSRRGVKDALHPPPNLCQELVWRWSRFFLHRFQQMCNKATVQPGQCLPLTEGGDRVPECPRSLTPLGRQKLSCSQQGTATRALSPHAIPCLLLSYSRESS